MIQWQDTYSTGIEKLDEQHKNLFRYSNDLEDGIVRGVASKQTLDGALRFLERYIKEHFGQEETCMYKYACPVADKNKLAHQQFIDAYKLFQKEITDGGDNQSVLKELHRFLEKWLEDHIGRIDSQLKSCI